MTSVVILPVRVELPTVFGGQFDSHAQEAANLDGADPLVTLGVFTFLAGVKG